MIKKCEIIYFRAYIQYLCNFNRNIFPFDRVLNIDLQLIKSKLDIAIYLKILNLVFYLSFISYFSGPFIVSLKFELHTLSYHLKYDYIRDYFIFYF